MRQSLKKSLDEKQMSERNRFKQLCERLTDLVQTLSKEEREQADFQNQLYQLVQNIQFFKKTLPEASDAAEIMLKQICRDLQYMLVPKNQAVFHYGDKADNFYLIMKGSAKVYIPKSEEEVENDFKKCSDLLQNLEKLNLPNRSSILLLELEKGKKNQISTDKKLYNMITSTYTENDRILALLLKDSFYFKDSVASKFKCIQELGSGDYFGELALTLGKPRGGSVVAVEDLHLFMLNKQQFKKIFDDYNKSIKWKIDYFSKHFNDICYFSMSSFCYFFKEQKFNTNQVLWREGEQPLFFFLIKTGQVELYKDVPIANSNKIGKSLTNIELEKALSSTQFNVKKQKRITISHIGPGTFVGGEDFFAQRKRIYNAVCLEVVEVYLMSAEDYCYVQKCFPDIMKQLGDQSMMQSQWLEKRINLTIETTMSRDEQLQNQRQQQDVYYERRTVKELQNMYKQTIQVAEQECQTIFSPSNSLHNSFCNQQQPATDENNNNRSQSPIIGSRDEQKRSVSSQSNQRPLLYLKKQIQSLKCEFPQSQDNQSLQIQELIIANKDEQNKGGNQLSQLAAITCPDMGLQKSNSCNNNISNSSGSNNIVQKIIRSSSQKMDINKQEMIEKKEKLFNLLISRDQKKRQPDQKNGIGLGFEQKPINQKQLELRLMKKYNIYNISATMANNPMFNQHGQQQQVHQKQPQQQQQQPIQKKKSLSVSPSKKQISQHQFIFNIIRSQVDAKSKIRKSSTNVVDQIILSSLKQNQGTQSSFSTPQRKKSASWFLNSQSSLMRMRQSGIKLERNANPKYQNREALLQQINANGYTNNNLNDSENNNPAVAPAGKQETKKKLIIIQKKKSSDAIESMLMSGVFDSSSRKSEEELMDYVQTQKALPIHSMVNSSTCSNNQDNLQHNNSSIAVKANQQLNRKRNIWLSLNKDKLVNKTNFSYQQNKISCPFKLWVVNSQYSHFINKVH